MTDTERRVRPMIAPPEEDPNATITCSSPPCFMHELDPAYLGYLGRDEVAALLGDLLAAEWFGTWLETAWLRAMLRRNVGRLGEVTAAEPGGDARDPAAASPDGRQDRLAHRVRAALPQLHDDALRRDLADLLGIMERDALRRRRDPD
jgi:hypothetical protein